MFLGIERVETFVLRLLKHVNNDIAYLENDLIPVFHELSFDNNHIFVQVGAPSQSASRTQNVQMDNVPAFVVASQCPPSSPDFNPLEYFI